jgi:hypothetical protein
MNRLVMGLRADWFIATRAGSMRERYFVLISAQSPMCTSIVSIRCISIGERNLSCSSVACVILSSSSASDRGVQYGFPPAFSTPSYTASMSGIACGSAWIWTRSPFLMRVE